jgi:hypothetical protein
MRKSILFLAAAVFTAAVHADTVQLTDGSSLSGSVTTLDNGDLKVVTGAGELTVEKSKVRAIVADGNAAGAEHRNEYVEKVLERRRAYGNEDGIPRSENLQSNQLMLTLGQLNYTGDAFTSTSSDLSGISYGLAYARSFTDFVAMEYWGDYSYASKDYTVAGSTTTLKLQRYNLGVGPKIQKAMRVGRVESGMVLIPNIGLSAVWSSANASASGAATTTSDFNSSSLGAAIGGGLDFQFGGALISAKVRYLLTTDVTGNSALKSSNTSALIPQVGVGFSF